MAVGRLAAALLLLAASTCVLAQYEYDYGLYGYGYDSYDTYNDFSYDEYGYYQDDDMQYYEYYGYYADDFTGYEDYYLDEYNDFFEECFPGEDGKPTLANGTVSCDLKITGVDKQADKLTGGIDGMYKLTSCYNGKPMYKRQKSPAGEDRVLWYSSTFGDWDVSKGTEPNEAEILMYGGEMEHATVPMYVSSWHLGADLKTETALGEDDYMPITVKITCSDGKVPQGKNVITNSQFSGPILTDEEIEAKYRYIYDKYAKAPAPNPTVNFTFVVLLVMTGLTIVLAIPYFLLKKKGPRGQPVSFAQMLQQTRKKAGGHVH